MCKVFGVFSAFKPIRGRSQIDVRFGNPPKFTLSVSDHVCPRGIIQRSLEFGAVIVKPNFQVNPPPAMLYKI
jgi:hypothetical protein